MRRNNETGIHENHQVEILVTDQGSHLVYLVFFVSLVKRKSNLIKIDRKIQSESTRWSILFFWLSLYEIWLKAAFNKSKSI